MLPRYFVSNERKNDILRWILCALNIVIEPYVQSNENNLSNIWINGVLLSEIVAALPGQNRHNIKEVFQFYIQNSYL